MAKPLVALVGRPNVGKSTLFNRLIGERYAVVHDAPGTTRDRLYGTVEWRGREFTAIDTGGIGLEGGTFDEEVLEQAEFAIQEADVVVQVVDAAAGLNPADESVADLLRRSHKPTLLAANKVDNTKLEAEAAQFYTLGLGDPVAISAHNGLGTGDLLDRIDDLLPPEAAEQEAEDVDVALAIVGRPNVGKSSLLNALLGRQRAIVSDVAGTTRDALDTRIDRAARRYLLIDTAGIRRRGKIERGVEQWSVLRAERAIDRADVAVLMLDADLGIAAQDAHVGGYVQERAKGLIIVLNKWDLVEKHPKIAEEYTKLVRRDLQFVDWAPILFVSSLTGQRVERIWPLADEIQANRQRRVPTSLLNQVVRDAFIAHPLTDAGRALKVYYATQVGTCPPTFALFVNNAELVHFSYRRYLENRLREAFDFSGTAIRLSFRGHQREADRRR